MQESQEVMGVVGPVIARVQLLGQREKGLRIVEEVGNFKDGFWIGNVVLLKVTVQATPRRPAEGTKGPISQNATENKPSTDVSKDTYP